MGVHRHLRLLPTLWLAVISFAIAEEDQIYANLCVLSEDSSTKIPIPLAPRVSGLSPIPDGSSLHCTSCNVGSVTGYFSGSHYIHLADGHVFVFDVDTCELLASLELNSQCTPKYIQRSSSHSNRYYVICQNGPRFQQLDYVSSSGEYHLSFRFSDLPSSPAAAIVGGTNLRYDTEDNYHVRILGNKLRFTELSSNDPYDHPLGQSDDCTTPTALHPMAPDTDDPQVVVTCRNANGDTRRYVVGGSSTQSIEASGTPALSPLGDYLLIVLPQGLQLYRTTDFSYASSTYTADILEVQFHQSGVGLYLSVAVAGQALRLLNVDTFVASGGSNGEVVVDEASATCPENSCLPHGLTGAQSDLFTVFIQEESSYSFLLFSLSNLKTLLKIPNINDRPQLALLPILNSSTLQMVDGVTTPVMQPSTSASLPQPSTSVHPNPSLTPSHRPSNQPALDNANGNEKQSDESAGFPPVETGLVAVFSVAIVVGTVASIVVTIRVCKKRCVSRRNYVKPISVQGFVPVQERSHSPDDRTAIVVAVENGNATPSLTVGGRVLLPGTPNDTPISTRKSWSLKADPQLGSDEVSTTTYNTGLDVLSNCEGSTMWTPEPSQQVCDD